MEVEIVVLRRRSETTTQVKGLCEGQNISQNSLYEGKSNLWPSEMRSILNSLFLCSQNKKVARICHQSHFKGTPREQISDSSLATTNCPKTAVPPKWGFISKETHRQKNKDNSHTMEKPPRERIPGFLNSRPCFHLLQITFAPLVPSQQHLPRDRKFTPNQNGIDQLQTWDFQIQGTASRSTPGTAEVPLVPLRSL